MRYILLLLALWATTSCHAQEISIYGVRLGMTLDELQAVIDTSSLRTSGSWMMDPTRRYEPRRLDSTTTFVQLIHPAYDGTSDRAIPLRCAIIQRDTFCTRLFDLNIDLYNGRVQRIELELNDILIGHEHTVLLQVDLIGKWMSDRYGTPLQSLRVDSALLANVRNHGYPILFEWSWKRNRKQRTPPMSARVHFRYRESGRRLFYSRTFYPERYAFSITFADEQSQRAQAAELRREERALRKQQRDWQRKRDAWLRSEKKRLRTLSPGSVTGLRDVQWEMPVKTARKRVTKWEGSSISETYSDPHRLMVNGGDFARHPVEYFDLYFNQSGLCYGSILFKPTPDSAVVDTYTRIKQILISEYGNPARDRYTICYPYVAGTGVDMLAMKDQSASIDAVWAIESPRYKRIIIHLYINDYLDIKLSYRCESLCNDYDAWYGDGSWYGEEPALETEYWRNHPRCEDE